MALLGILLGSALVLSTPFVAPLAAATPYSGPEPTPTNLLLYLHNASRGVTVGSETFNDVLSTQNDTSSSWFGTGGLSVGVHYDSVSFAVAPQLAGDLLLNGTVEANLWLNESGSSPNGGSITVTVDELSGSGQMTVLGVGPANSASILGPGGSVPKLVTLTGPALTRAVPAGNSLVINVTISGNTAEGYGIWWGDVAGTYYFSDVVLPASTYLVVAPPVVLNASGVPTTQLPTNVANKTVRVEADVSDPLGAYDFESWAVDLSIYNATGVRLYGPVPLAPIPSRPAPSNFSGEFGGNYNYSALAPGIYTFSVNATDNTNHDLWAQSTPGAFYGRAAFGNLTVTIGQPPLREDFEVTDASGHPLDGALLRAYSGSILVGQNLTNASGASVLLLPGETEYRLQVVWEGVFAGSFPIAVSNATQTFSVKAWVYSPEFRLVAPNGAGIPYALVSVIHPNGTTLPLVVSSSVGTFQLTEVPVGNYTVSVIFDDVQVLSAKSVPVNSDGPIVVPVSDVFPLTVQTMTSGGSALAGVFIQVRNTTTGASLASGITSSNGSLVFLVPAGTYDVVGSWSSTYDLTALSQTQNATVVVSGPTLETLHFSRAWPPFTSTTLFDYAVGIGLLALVAAVLAGLWVHERRRGGRSSGKAGPAAEITKSDSPVSPPLEGGNLSAPPSPPEGGSAVSMPKKE
jgi:hypothetical protein